MKQFLTLFLIVTLFYNVLEYYLMYAFQEEQTWVSTLDKVPNSEFQVICLNASLYSFMEDTDFESVNENVIIKNKSYHIFKKRIQNNILSLYYLPNSYGDVIGKELKDIVYDNLYNNDSSKEMPSKKILKSFLPDYIPNNITCFNLSFKPFLNSNALIITPHKALNSGYLSILYTPPDIA